MRIRFRQVLSIVAIIAIALHSALWGGPATRPATAAVDPFSVICHSGGNADRAPDPAPDSTAPGHAAAIVTYAARRLRPRHRRPLSSFSSFQVNHRTPSSRHRLFHMAESKSR
jgi:hypothetical protein